MTSQDERKALNQDTFRMANERLEENAREVVGVVPDALVPFLCECPRQSCTQVVLVTLEEYERVRSDGRLGIEAIAHDDGSVEWVVERNERFIVTDKFGEAGKVAEATDPRG